VKLLNYAFPVMLSVGRCGVARLQMKVGHMDGMHCFIALHHFYLGQNKISLII